MLILISLMHDAAIFSIFLRELHAGSHGKNQVFIELKLNNYDGNGRIGRIVMTSYRHSAGCYAVRNCRSDANDQSLCGRFEDRRPA